MPLDPKEHRERILRMFDAGFSRRVEEGVEVAPPPLAAAPATAAAELEDTAEKLRVGAEVTEQQLGDLEAVVHTEGYPALRVEDDEPRAFTGRWAFMEGAVHRAALRIVLRSLGRIEAIEPSGRPYLGTGWVVAPGRLLTNRHVASFFVNGRGQRHHLEFLGGRAPRLDRKRERSQDGTDPADIEVRRITGVRMVHPHWDAAILEFDGPAYDVLPIFGAEPAGLDSAAVAVVGYPGRATLTPQVATDVFEDTFGVKRVSPGNLTGTAPKRFAPPPGHPEDPEVVALRHDASTLGGNSGSAVVYLPKLGDGALPAGFGGVVALHYAGVSGSANYAVPVWELLRDLRFREALGDDARVEPARVGSEPEPSWIEIWSSFAAPPADDGHEAGAVEAVHACDETGDFPEGEEALEAPDALVAKERSGAQWVARYPGSRSIDALASPFRENVRRFTDALRAAGATVSIAATFRPPERAYLMHWAWKIARDRVAPASALPRDGVPIEWVHDTLEASIAAAEAMVTAYGMAQVAVLRSRHTAGLAIDAAFEWTKEITLTAPDGSSHVVPPGVGRTSQALWAVGARFGVIKLQSDPPHWSSDGR